MANSELLRSLASTSWTWLDHLTEYDPDVTPLTPIQKRAIGRLLYAKADHAAQMSPPDDRAPAALGLARWLASLSSDGKHGAATITLGQVIGRAREIYPKP